MTRLTRNFLLASVVVVVLGLCTGLVAYYNGGLMISAASPDELTYLPEGTGVVAHADVGQIMKSDFRKRIQQDLPTGEEKDKLQSETGIDLERDIDTVVAGFGGTASDGHEGIVLVRGRFDEPKIQALATDHGGHVEQYKGHTLVIGGGGGMPVPAMSHGGDLQGGVAFLGPALVALGSQQTLERAIDSHDDGQNVTKDADLMKFVHEVDRSSNAWVAGRFDAVSHAGMLPGAAEQRLAAVQWFAITAHVDNGINGVIRADARDDQSAQDLRDVVRGGLAAARLFTTQNPKLTAVVNSLQVSGTGKTVSVSFVASPEALDMLSGVAGLANLANVKKVAK